MDKAGGANQGRCECRRTDKRQEREEKWKERDCSRNLRNPIQGKQERSKRPGPRSSRRMARDESNGARDIIRMRIIVTITAVVSNSNK